MKMEIRILDSDIHSFIDPFSVFMNNSLANIREKRFALLELNSLMNHVHTLYKGNPPIEVLTGIAELAKCYSKKYGSAQGNHEDNLTLEFHSFCAKNRLLL